MENATWKIDNSRINIEIAKWIIEIINHHYMKDSLGLLNRGTYRTFSDDMKYKLSIHDSGFVTVIDQRANVVHYGMFHLMKQKLKEIYPSIEDV